MTGSYDIILSVEIIAICLCNRLSGGCFCVSVGNKDLGEYEYAENLCYDKYRL